MASNNVEGDSSTSELKYLGFVKEFAVKILVVLSNVYEYAKENSGSLKSTVVFLEDAAVATMGPIYDKIKDVPEQILVSLDEKIDQYTPTFIKNLVAKIQALIQKLTPSAEKLITAVKTAVAPLITATTSLLQKALTTIKSLLQKFLAAIKSPLQNLLTTIKSLLKNLLSTIKSLLQNLLTFIESLPLLGKIKTLLQNLLATIQSKLQIGTDTKSESESVLEKVGSVIDDTRETAGNIVGNIPILGDTAKDLITNPAGLVGDAIDKTGSLVGNIPFLGDTAKDLITNPAGLVGDAIDKTGSLVENTPILGDVASKAQDFAKEAQITGLKTAINSAYAAFKVVALPSIAQFWYKANQYPLFHALAGVLLPVLELLAKWYNHVVTYMDKKGYRLFEFTPLVPIDEMRAAYKVVKTMMDGLSTAGDLVGVGGNNH